MPRGLVARQWYSIFEKSILWRTYVRLFLLYILNFYTVKISIEEIWVKVFENEPSKIWGRQLLKVWQTISLQIFQRPSFTNFAWSIFEYLDLCFLSIEIVFKTSNRQAWLTITDVFSIRKK